MGATTRGTPCPSWRSQIPLTPTTSHENMTSTLSLRTQCRASFALSAKSRRRRGAHPASFLPLLLLSLFFSLCQTAAPTTAAPSERTSTSTSTSTSTTTTSSSSSSTSTSRSSSRSSSSTSGSSNRDPSFLPPEGQLHYSRGLFWWVHLSDVHVSEFVPSRAADLDSHFVAALQIIRPPLLVITGDLTDAKNRWRTTTSQNQSEWVTYAAALDRIQHYCVPLPRPIPTPGSDASNSGRAGDIPGPSCGLSIMDLRGNHDTFEVPQRGGAGDFYPRYSASRKDSAVRWLLVSPSEQANPAQPSLHPSIAFVALDIAPRVGIRGPANFFAHPLDRDLEDLQAVLSQAEEREGFNPSAGMETRGQGKSALGDSGFQESSGRGTSENGAGEGPSKGRGSGVSGGGGGVVKIVMGHYPLSFATRAPSGRRTEGVLSQGRCDAYLAGHLHYKFGTRMYRWYGATATSPPSSSPTTTSSSEGSRGSLSRGSIGSRGAEAGVREASSSSSSDSHSVAGEGELAGEGRHGSSGRATGFWELGVGDWKDNRVMRVMAVDRGRVSFAEFRLLSSVPQSGQGRSAGFAFAGGAPVVLLTSPQDARLKPRDTPPHPPSPSPVPLEPLIRALVFSSGNVTAVTALILRQTTVQDTPKGGPEGGPMDPLVPPSASSDRKHLSPPIEASRLEPVQSLALTQETEGGGEGREGGGKRSSPVYSCQWQPARYAGGAPGEYWLRVTVEVAGAGQFLSDPQPFVVDSQAEQGPGGKGQEDVGQEKEGQRTNGQGEDGQRGGGVGEVKWVPMEQTWLEVGILGVDWDDWWPAVRWAPFAFIWTVLALAKLLHVLLFRHVPAPDLPLAVYKRTRILRSPSAPHPTPPRPLPQSLLLLPVSCLEFLAFSLLSFGGEPAWWVLAPYSAYLATGPWFLGYGLGTRCPPGWMSLRGWIIATCQPAATTAAAAAAGGLTAAARAGAGEGVWGALTAGAWASFSNAQRGLAVPDIVTTVFPILFFCFVPMLLWVPLILGEGPFWHALRQEQGSRQGPRGQGQGYGHEKGAPGAHAAEGEGRDEAGYSDASESASLLLQSQENVTKRCSSRNSLLVAAEPIEDGGVPERSPQCGAGAGQGASAERGAWQGQGGRRGRQLGCCCLALSPCSCCQCLLRLLLWLCLPFPGLVYLHQCKAVAGAFGAVAVTVSPGLSWFPGFIVAALVASRGYSFWRHACKED